MSAVWQWSYLDRNADVLAWRLTVRGYPTQGPNKVLGSGLRYRLRYKANIKLVVASARGAPTFTVPVELTYCRGYRATPMDEDNLAASAKPCLDALKKAGVIVDDAPAWLSLTCSQEKRSTLAADWTVTLHARPQPTQ